MIRSHHTVAAPKKVLLLLLQKELTWMKYVTFTCNTQHIHVRLGHLYNEPPFYRNGSTNPPRSWLQHCKHQSVGGRCHLKWPRLAKFSCYVRRQACWHAGTRRETRLEHLQPSSHRGSPLHQGGWRLVSSRLLMLPHLSCTACRGGAISVLGRCPWTAAV
jgi:hypothetical protein